MATTTDRNDLDRLVRNATWLLEHNADLPTVESTLAALGACGQAWAQRAIELTARGYRDAALGASDRERECHAWMRRLARLRS